MVSLADSRLPSPPSPSAKIQRSHAGRSMRTIRSNLFSSSAAPAPAAAPVSEILTDSFVDFHLHHLAVTPPPSASKPPVSDLLDLDLSLDFSSSSFSSDISGELHRLSLTPTPPRPRDLVSHDPSLVPDGATPEAVEPAVRACVESLGSPSATPQAKRAAAARLRHLAKHRSDFRALIAAAGAIPALVPLLRSTDPEAQENAVTALLNLSLEEDNRAAVTAAGAIKPLVYVLRTGTAVAKQNAACALLSLSMIEDNRITIGACGAVPLLVALLVHGTARGKKDALTTLYKLCSARQNKERAVRAGAAAPLVALAGERGGGTAEKAMVVLHSLAGIPEGQAAIVEAGGITALVEAMEDGPPKGKEFALLTLLQLCSDSPGNCGLLVRDGAIPPLVALSQSSSTRIKRKAETLLGYLREQRLDGMSTGLAW